MYRYVVTLSLAAVGWYGLTALRSRCGGAAPLFRAHELGADFVDQYCAPLKHRVSIDEVAEHAVQKGAEVARSATEVVYEDRAPGLRFVVGYKLADDRASLHFSTAVFYDKPIGRLYFLAVRPFHRMLAPGVASVTARRAA